MSKWRQDDEMRPLAGLHQTTKSTMLHRRAATIAATVVAAGLFAAMGANPSLFLLGKALVAKRRRWLAERLKERREVEGPGGFLASLRSKYGIDIDDLHCGEGGAHAASSIFQLLGCRAGAGWQRPSSRAQRRSAAPLTSC